MSSIVRFSHTNSHGGVVTDNILHTSLNGKPMAGKGHMVMCPLCKGPFPIAEGSSTYSVNGIPVALDGMKTTCGATLIASGSRGSVHR
ncbi:PAAR domain-containing protein [Pseudomonas reactans]|uniref:PAAR domain-containing protein n=1 Tax=Pseudomonas reactans TaxID=117680 RepID=UPI0015B8554C|nr:PAAR domain-containing protein [Pseudomonas reactans]NWD83030.1 PAAR domain-containing protein [Pseudomonas reactans]